MLSLLATSSLSRSIIGRLSSEPRAALASSERTHRVVALRAGSIPSSSDAVDVGRRPGIRSQPALGRVEEPVPPREVSRREAKPLLHRLEIDERLVDCVDLIPHSVLILGLDKLPWAGGLDRCSLTIGKLERPGGFGFRRRRSIDRI